MNLKKIYLCDNNIDGIFTAIYKAWSSRYGHSNIKIEEKCEGSKYSNIELFAEYIIVDTDYNLAIKVAKSIKEKISEEAYEMVCRVALSDYSDKADLIYRFLILGFANGSKIIEHLSNEVVNNVFKINRNVNNEAHHMLGFLRFSQQENGLLTSVIHPKNHVLSIITPHFVDRLSGERFLIFDENRRLASIHVPGESWILIKVGNDHELNQLKETSLNGDQYQDLWKTFFDHIAIKERINFSLQRNNLPLRFRGDMTEFQIKESLVNNH
jgi:probable DNA metabolism protein